MRSWMSPRPQARFAPLMRLAALVVGGTLMAVGVVTAGESAGNAAVEESPAAAAVSWPVVFPDQAVQGVLRFDVPLGAYARFEEGELGYVVPSVIRLKVGDRVIVTNHDEQPHMILYAFVPAGATTTLTYQQPGRLVFSSGCAANPAANSFSTIIVSA